MSEILSEWVHIRTFRRPKWANMDHMFKESLCSIASSSVFEFVVCILGKAYSMTKGDICASSLRVGGLKALNAMIPKKVCVERSYAHIFNKITTYPYARNWIANCPSVSLAFSVFYLYRTQLIWRVTSSPIVFQNLALWRICPNSTAEGRPI